MTDKSESAEVATQPETPQANGVSWSPFLAIIYALVSFGLITQLAVPAALYSALVVTGKTSQQALAMLQHSIAWQFVYVLLAEGIMFGAVWWFLKKHKKGLRTIGWRRLRWSDGVVTLCGFAVYFVTYAILLAIATHYIPSFNAGQKQELGFDNVAGTGNLLLTFASLVVLPPIVEETLFRGFIFTSLRGKSRFAWSALITSVLFALAHLEFGSGKPLLWVAALDTFTLSLVLCYLREKTDSLWPGILLHALKNGIAFISLYLLHLS